MQIHSRRHAAPRRHPLTLALWAAALCIPGTMAMAQEATTAPAPAPEAENTQQLDTIVVTAQKREQQIQEVPIAISAYSGEFLEKNGMDNYQSLGTLVPDIGRLSNRMWCYFAQDATIVTDRVDVEEGITRLDVTEVEALAMAADGRMQHALNLSALFLAVSMGKLSLV